MHLWAYTHPAEADGERFIACSGFGPPQAVADILREVYGDRIPIGNPGEGYIGFDKENGKVEKVDFPVGRVSVSGEKAERIIGIEFIPLQKSILDNGKVFECYL